MEEDKEFIHNERNHNEAKINSVDLDLTFLLNEPDLTDRINPADTMDKEDIMNSEDAAGTMD